MDKERASAALTTITRKAALLSAGLALFILLVRVFVHFPFYDESMHLRYLWMVSNGFRAGVDFFDAYPLLAYFFVKPFFQLFPDTTLVLLPLRLLSVALYVFAGALLYLHAKRLNGEWEGVLTAFAVIAASANIGPFMVEYSIDPLAALSAFAAFYFLFKEPDEKTITASAGFSLLSVLLTPKYSFPLFFALLGHLYYYWQKEKDAKGVILRVAAGGGAALLAAIILYALNSESLLSNLSNSTVLTSKLQLTRNEGTLFSMVLLNMAQRPVLALFLGLSLAGFAKRALEVRDHVTLAGAGLLLGLLLFTLRVQFQLEQYQAPVYFSLLFLSPFAFTLIRDRLTSASFRFLLIAAALFSIGIKYPPLLKEFGGTTVYRRDAENENAVRGPTGVAALGELDRLLASIPKNEKVAALWPHHPMLRKDITPIPGDDRPSYSSVLKPSDPRMRFFDPNAYVAALIAKPPAFVDPGRMHTNYPPEWLEITMQFLEKHRDIYTQLPSYVEPGNTVYIRNDLLEPQR